MVSRGRGITRRVAGGRRAGALVRGAGMPHIAGMPFAILLLLYAFLEIAGFVAMSNAVGLLGVFALVILGIVAGGFIIRTIGLASVRRMQDRAEAGETVGQELGGLVLGFLGGLLLILPGFLSDLVGILLLIKPVQVLVWPRYGRQVASRMPDFERGGRWQSPGHRQGPEHPRGETVVIDAEPLDGPDDDSSRTGTTDRRGSNPWGT